MSKVKEARNNDQASIGITVARLNELLDNAVAMDCPYELTKLTYPQAQAVLTLFALSKLLGTYGLAPPYRLDLEKVATFNEEPDWESPVKQSFGGRRARHK